MEGKTRGAIVHIALILLELILKSKQFVTFDIISLAIISRTCFGGRKFSFVLGTYLGVEVLGHMQVYV